VIPGIDILKQTLVEVAAENNSTTIFPVPIDILKALLRGAGDRTT